jgi:hypothetical protein
MGDRLAPEVLQDVDVLKFFIQDLLERAASTGKHILVVLDGLDEALQGSFDPSIIPTRLPPTIRVVASARWQVGDRDSTGWVKRLGWDRSIRTETIDLPRLSPEAIADVLLKLGAPTDVLAHQGAVIDRLIELTEGEPILVRYYAEDLWKLGQQSPRVTIDDLNSLKPGFGSYFERLLSYQERLWADEGSPINRREVDRVLSVLAFALGPLESRDLLDLISEVHRTDNLLSEHNLLLPLRRFIIGSGKADSGYCLSHPKIAKYLQTERFAGSSLVLRRSFVTPASENLHNSRLVHCKTSWNAAFPIAPEFCSKLA